jgi:hypothetical protein
MFKALVGAVYLDTGECAITTSKVFSRFLTPVLGILTIKFIQLWVYNICFGFDAPKNVFTALQKLSYRTKHLIKQYFAFWRTKLIGLLKPKFCLNKIVLNAPKLYQQRV